MCATAPCNSVEDDPGGEWLVDQGGPHQGRPNLRPCPVEEDLLLDAAVVSGEPGASVPRGSERAWGHEFEATGRFHGQEAADRRRPEPSMT